MNKPLLVVHTNPSTGRAEVSHGDRDLVQKRLAGVALEPIQKKPNEAAAPHHPGVIIYLRVLEGAHMVMVPNAAGTTVELLVLEAGDDIVFADMATTVKPQPSPVCFTGHASQAGKAGNRFERCPLAVTLEELKLKARSIF